MIIILNNKVKLDCDTNSKSAVTNFIIGYLEGCYTFKTICTLQEEGNERYFQIDKYCDCYKVNICYVINENHLCIYDFGIRGTISEIVVNLLKVIERGNY